MKQYKTNTIFIQMVTDAYHKQQSICTITGFCEWLVRSGIFPENALNRWLAVMIYKKELEATKTEKKPKGVKWLAVQNTVERVPICARKLHSLLNNMQKGEMKSKPYFLQETDNQKP